MDILKPSAVVGTNSWGSAAYGKMLRGESVGVDTIRACFERAKEKGLLIFDLAQDYGLGKAQKMIGEFGTEDVIISAKFTPTGSYKSGQVRKSFEKDLQDFNRDYVDIYWLHLPSDIEANLSEIIDLYKEGKIKHVGISNFTLEECVKAKAILDKAGISLYGVQNHYSLINREWEKNGLVDWCFRNGISFWAWAVLEEGMLTDPKVKTKMSLMKLMFNRKKRKLHSLYQLMEKVGEAHGITIPQVAMAFCASKGIVPVCGCRKPYQVDQLQDAVSVTLSDSEIKSLENEADKLNVKILGADMFRFAVKKSK
ncbi:Predicted oxidoreductase [Pseudobutyrivibrio sp. AR14]|uniref:aldo/keto reductase n=1 Tax=Pseudobutyrivibrio sp. AR14 TaxID=1520804 RepID=UPI00088291A2|nr:aldo/keto reductase [Pseudobutyrivibrio sp. AR14]SCY49881.1 Predicted oxidoreductase [Pseudobutyrivibrio sp. AR14]